MFHEQSKTKILKQFALIPNAATFTQIHVAILKCYMQLCQPKAEVIV